MKNAPLRHGIEHGAYLGARSLMRALPYSAVRALGRRLGDALWLGSAGRRRVAINNVARALPELGRDGARRLARASFQHLGLATCDTLRAGREDLAGLCKRLALEGFEHLEAVAGSERGFFVLSAHLGCWEIAALISGAYFGPLHVVGRPLDNPHLDRELVALRQRFGNVTMAKRGAVRGMLRALDGGGMVGILIDQRVRPEEGIVVPFFGLPSFASPVLARLALRTGATVVPIFCVPEPKGRYRFIARPPVAPEGKADDPEAVAAMTARYLAATEAEIRRYPEQWMWMHRRWKEMEG